MTKANGERSFDVVKRAAFKLTFFLLAAALQVPLGLGFTAPLAIVAFGTSVSSMFIGTWLNERIDAPHDTSFDESVWFFALGYAVHRYF